MEVQRSPPRAPPPEQVSASPMWTLRFHGGTLVVEGASVDELPPGFRHDARIGAPRGPAWLYAETVLQCRREERPHEDLARAWAPLEDRPLRTLRTPRPYQQEAVEAWVKAGRRGAIILPTGSGKTFVAELCIASTRRPTLVITPTLDLVGQWHAGLTASFGGPIGILGGGFHELEAITVSTYDSAFIHCARYGDRFALVVFDEVHHLPAPAWLSSAESMLAPFRLGLTATWERDDGRHEELDHVVGPVRYRKEISELAGDFLAEYETVRLLVQLGPEEQARYDAAHQRYTDFVKAKGIIFGRDGFGAFLRAAARSPEGRAAHKAFLEFKEIVHGTPRKLELLARLLHEEAGRRTIVFTNDNATAYLISRSLLVPCISHQTDIKERRAILDGFASGALPVIVTSRVLNEGVDMPNAEVGVVLSGTSTVREHVQRLGRILRPKEGKRAILYELVTTGTTEERASARRRKHDAYQ